MNISKFASDFFNIDLEDLNFISTDRCDFDDIFNSIISLY